MRLNVLFIAFVLIVPRFITAVLRAIVKSGSSSQINYNLSRDVKCVEDLINTMYTGLETKLSNSKLLSCLQ